MNTDYQETGGLRWGENFWFAANASWPFATLTATPENLHVSMRCIGITKKDFVFAKSDVKAIRRKKGILPFSKGIVIEHQKSDFPRFILFWTFDYAKLKRELTRLGFTVTDNMEHF